MALNVLWLVLISAWLREEAILGLFASAVAATAAQAVREQDVAGFEPRLRWLRHLRRIPRRVVRDTAFLLAALARQAGGRGPVRGRFRVVPVDLPDDPREQAAKRALLTAGESFAPNAYVVTIDNREGLMLVHELRAEDER